MLQKDKSSQFEKELKGKLQKFTNKNGEQNELPAIPTLYRHFY